MEIVTAHGPAEAVLDEPDGPAGLPFLLVLTHGSNGGVDAPDLLAVRDVALGLGGAVARVLQPFRAAGRRAPGPAAKQDEAWLEIVGALRRRYGDVPLVQGGRSNGARVACRTAREAGAAGVIALAFPLHPPGKPDKSRAGELRAAGVEVLVVNGDRDPFGIPDAADAAQVAVLPGERHDLAKDPAAAGAAAGPWLRRWSAGPRAAGRRPAGAGRTTA
ncbi:alpha/beta hydrolase family protein [Actinomadura xylanilytica]|uniref:alpha/beta hydrolase family protein n=1 Tax=Actinomadura xylanilytica TaxID=887459 RepID=UPI00255A7A76|nr:alpha/beta family hydrolase [Actinomadura xylanilytica]MDL4776578.1 alpha/beta hydrolase [Actinomadura xylanilytica]